MASLTSHALIGRGSIRCVRLGVAGQSRVVPYHTLQAI